MQAARPRLSRATVLAAALDLIDRKGLDGLSMRRLGRQLGVEGMALYNHVRNKEDLLDGVVGLLSAEVAIPADETGDWRARLAEVVRSYRAIAKRHPNAFPLIALRPLRTPEAQEPYERAVRIAAAAVGEDAARTFGIVLASYANGFALNELSGGFTASPDELDREFERGLRLILSAAG